MSSSTGTTAEMETEQESRIDAEGVSTRIVVCLGPWYQDASAEALSPLLQILREGLREFAAETLVAYPVSDPQASSWQHEGLLLQPYQTGAQLHTLSVHTAATYLSVFEVMRNHGAACGLLLGPDAHTVNPLAIRGMVEAVIGSSAIDLALPRYSTGANEGLINASMLHPLTRAVFGVRAQFPLALDFAMSERMAERMAGAAQRFTSASQPDALLWPAAEAAVAAFTIAEVSTGIRELPHPGGADLSSIINTVAASLFNDVEAKAQFWQRTHPPIPVLHVDAAAATPDQPEPVRGEEIAELIDAFRIGYGNLHEIWALVLPPQTLLGLKRLSRLPNEEFSLPDALWVRVVYDYVLAHRQRTINRGHLLGSLTPLYLAWVASHILAGQQGTYTGGEALAKAFEADKPYLVSRWRWPDRFNP